MTSRDLFPGLEPTRAPAGLRNRVLTTALGAAAEPQPGLVDRLWSSTGLRIAWVGCVLVLLFANLVGTGPGTTALPQPAPLPIAQPGLPVEVHDLLAASWRARQATSTAADRRLLEQVLAETARDLS